MTTVSNPTTDSIVYVVSSWNIVDDRGFVMDTISIETSKETPVSERAYIAVCEFADMMRDAHEPGDYKAEVVINSISHAVQVNS